MYLETEYNYGADADGNRGITIHWVELECSKEEREEIAEMLFQHFLEGYSGTIELYYEDYEFEVELEDYLDELLVLLEERKDEVGLELYEEIIESYKED